MRSYYTGSGDDLYYKDAEFRSFASWAEVLEHVKTERVVWYQAPLSWRPSSCKAVAGPAEHHEPGGGMTTIPEGALLMLPAPQEGDPFFCREERLAMFRRRVGP